MFRWDRSYHSSLAICAGRRDSLKHFGDPILVDETLSPMDPERIQRGDAVGISIHTANALRGYEIGNLARERGAYVIFGGIHATLYPEEARELGGAHSIVTDDGDVAWPPLSPIARKAHRSRFIAEARSKPAVLRPRAGT